MRGGRQERRCISTLSARPVHRDTVPPRKALHHQAETECLEDKCWDVEVKSRRLGRKEDGSRCCIAASSIPSEAALTKLIVEVA